MSGHVQDRLSAFLDEELPPREREAVEAHLRTCPACAGHLDLLRAVDEGARALPVSVPPGYFEALPGRIRGRLEKTPRPAARRIPVWTWAVAAALLLGVVTPLTLNRAQLPRPEPEAHYPAPAVAAPPGTALPATGDLAPGPAPLQAPATRALQESATAKDGDDAKLRKQAAANRADRPAPAPTVLGARALEEADAKAEIGRLQDARGAEQEPPARALALRERKAGPGGPSAQQQVPLQSQATPAYAPPPAASPAESVALAETVEAPRDEAQASREKAAGGTAAGRVSSAVGASDERVFRRLVDAAPPVTLASLREKREAWRAFTRDFPSSPRADEARVRVIETGAEAWRVGGDPSDLARLREDATAYLARRDAAQAARVRALLEGLPAGS